MKTERRKVGDLAEDIVVKYVRGKGWKILARNYTKKWGEIDIVARDGAAVIFIEVKAQKVTPGVTLFKPEDHFNSKKKKRLLRACQSYLLENNYQDDADWRVDLAAVELNSETKIARLRYYRNVLL